MANHCWNHARITGSKSKLDEIERRIKDSTDAVDYYGQSNFWWEPFKEFFKGMEYDFTSLDVYKEFGAKWFSCNVERWSDTELILSGDSAWSPVCPFLLKISESFYVDIEHTFEESGCDIGGWFNCSNGNVTRDEAATYMYFIEKEDPGRGFEEAAYRIECGYYDSLDGFIKKHRKEYELFKDHHKRALKDLFNQNQQTSDAVQK